MTITEPGRISRCDEPRAARLLGDLNVEMSFQRSYWLRSTIRCFAPMHVSDCRSERRPRAPQRTFTGQCRLDMSAQRMSQAGLELSDRVRSI